MYFCDENGDNKVKSMSISVVMQQEIPFVEYILVKVVLYISLFYVVVHFKNSKRILPLWVSHLTLF